MKIRDIVTVPSIPRVVQLAAVERLSAALDSRAAGRPAGSEEELEAQLSGYLEQYFLVDARTRTTVQTLLIHLATHRDHGEAFFVKGLYGSGKSHLLAVLRLLLEHPVAWDFFLRTHPEFAQCAERFLAQPPLLAVAVALDEYDGRDTALEDILFREAERALRRPRLDIQAPLTEESYALELIDRHLAPRYAAELADFLRQELHLTATWAEVRAADPAAALAHARRFIQRHRIPLEFRQSRVERLGRLLELVQERGLGGVVFLLDELSVFLSSKSPPGLQNDASFLQFLGQRAHLLPLWAVATLQKNIEDVGDVEAYTLQQIKDRWQTRLSLALTEARQVVSRKLLVKPDLPAFQQGLEAAYQFWTGGQRPRGWSRAALEETYPLHPQTLTLLEACADRFLSKTRSLIDFVQAQVAGDGILPGILDQPVTTLITPDVLYDHFAREIAQNPSLARFHEAVFRYYAQNAAALFGEEAALGLRLVKLLVLSRLAGVEPAVREMAAALLPAAPDREARVQALLETMYSHGSFVTVQRRPGEYADLYTIDLDFEVNEAIRRRVRSIAEALAPDDGRMETYAVDCCIDPEFRLAIYRRPTTLSIVWRNTRRSLLVHLRDLALLSGDEAANLTALLANPDTEESAYLFIARLFHPDLQRQAWEAALAGLAEERWAQALVAWFPRPLTPEEREQLRQDTAHELLRQDPTLGDSRPGAALLERLNEGVERRRARTEALVKQAYYEGEIRTWEGRKGQAADLAPLCNHWMETLQQAAGWGLEAVFPLFREYAPRRRLFSRACAHELIRDFIAVGAVQTSPASTLAGYIADYAAPLGIVAGEEGDYRVSVRGTPLARAVLSGLPASPDRPVSLGEMEQRLAKSEFGLVPELTHLLVAALIKKGFITALDDAQQPLPTHRLTAPLRAYLAFLARADPLPAELWPPLRQLAQELLASPPPGETLAAQQGLWEELRAYRGELLARVDRLENACAEVQQALGHDEMQWLRAAEVLDRLRSLADTIEPEAITAAGLERFVRRMQRPPFADPGGGFGPLRDLLEQSHLLERFATETAPELLRWHRDLHDPQLALPEGSPLAVQRDQLVQLLAGGDEVAFLGDEFRALAAAFRENYVSHYLAWHHRVHAPSRFEPYLQLKTHPLYRLLERLAGLPLGLPQDLARVEEQIRQELAKRCRALDLRSHLEQRLVCPGCGLAYGQTLDLRPLGDLTQELQEGVRKALAALRAEARRKLLEQALSQPETPASVREHVAPLLDADGAPPEVLLDHLTPETMEFLQRVLTTRIVARRQLSELLALLANRALAKRELLQVFLHWLDAANQIAPEEIVAVEWSGRESGETVSEFWKPLPQSSTVGSGPGTAEPSSQKGSASQTRTGGIEEV